MKKLYGYFKTLLVAAGLLMGANAWAANTPVVYDFEDGNAVFSGRSRVTVAIEDDATLGSKVVGFTCAGNAQNGYSFADYDMTALTSKAQKVTINFDYYNTQGGRSFLTIGDASVRGTTGGSSKTTYNSVGAIFRIGSNKDNAFVYNDAKLKLADYCNKWLNVNVVVDVTNKKVSYTVKEKSSGTVLNSGEDKDYWQSATACTQIDVFGFINNSHMAMIDNLSITASVDESVKFADYKVVFYDQTAGEEIKNETRNGQAATAIDLLADDTKDFKSDDGTIKYIYVSNDAASKTIAEDGTTVVTVNFRQAETWNYSVNAKYGNTVLESLPDGSVFEGDKAYVTHQLYYNVNGNLVTKASEDTKSYNFTITPNKDNYEATIPYTATNISNIVFFAEAEDIEALEPATSGYLAERFSGGMGAYAKDEAKVITTLAPGKYKLTAQILGTYSACTFTFKAGETTIWENTTGSGSYYIGAGITSDEFEILANTDITLEAGGGDGSSSKVRNLVDFIYIQRTDAVTKTVSAAGYATFCAPYALDFAGTGLTAYIATATKDKVSFTEVTSVPANTGVLLKGEAKEYTIPVAASSATDVSANVLEAVLTSKVITAATGYVLLGTPKVGFYKNANDFTLSAGTAYIPVANIPTEARGFIGLDDETTGVASVATELQPAATLYDLQGRRVVKAQKGLYILNGKKVVKR